MCVSGSTWRAVAACSILALSAPIAQAQGALDVDADAAERALERTLALEGTVLLPPGTFETVGSLTYDYFDFKDLGGTQRTRRDRLIGRLELRYGLPFDAQIELSLPYNRVHERIDKTAPPVTSTSDTGSGAGDIRLGFAKTLMRENGSLPDLVGRISYDSASGDDEDNGVSLTSDAEELELSLHALKRLDPLALSARLGYEWSFEKNNVDYGDTVSLGLAASLAASPATSVSIGLDASWGDEARVGGVKIAGSSSNQAVLKFGVSSIVARNTLANVSVGAGLTDDSSDYYIGFSLSRRFSTR